MEPAAVRALAVAAPLLLCAGCWGGLWGGDDGSCLAEVELEGSRWVHSSTQDELIFENGQVILRRPDGSDTALTMKAAPTEFEPVDCRYGQGRPAEHAQRRMTVLRTMENDVLRVEAQDGFRFAATGTAAAVLQLEDASNTTRRSVSLDFQVDESGGGLSVPLEFDEPLTGDFWLGLEVVVGWTLIDAEGDAELEVVELRFSASCADGSCEELRAAPSVECL